MLGRRITLRQRIEARIAKRRDDAFLTREFLDLGGTRQVLRALRELTERGKLIRLGYGVYGRTDISSLSSKPILYNLNGLEGAARQVLTKLDVSGNRRRRERAYNEASTQVPLTPAVRIRGRPSAASPRQTMRSFALIAADISFRKFWKHRAHFFGLPGPAPSKKTSLSSALSACSHLWMRGLLRLSSAAAPLWRARTNWCGACPRTWILRLCRHPQRLSAAARYAANAARSATVLRQRCSPPDSTSIRKTPLRPDHGTKIATRSISFLTSHLPEMGRGCARRSG